MGFLHTLVILQIILEGNRGICYSRNCKNIFGSTYQPHQMSTVMILVFNKINANCHARMTSIQDLVVHMVATVCKLVIHVALAYNHGIFTLVPCSYDPYS